MQKSYALSSRLHGSGTPMPQAHVCQHFAFNLTVHIQLRAQRFPFPLLPFFLSPLSHAHVSLLYFNTNLTNVSVLCRSQWPRGLENVCYGPLVGSNPARGMDACPRLLYR
jgi:hypothetical protein